MQNPSLAQFPPLVWLTSQWQTIRDEALALDRTDIIDIPVTDSPDSRTPVARHLLANGRVQWVTGWHEHAAIKSSADWLIWGLGLMDQYPLDTQMPRTVELLRQISGIKVVSVSLFKPGLVLGVHRHPEFFGERLLTYHLGLDVPPASCYLHVRGTRGTPDLMIEEADGHGITFNGGHPHSACNHHKTRDRLIIYMEFYRDRLARLTDRPADLRLAAWARTRGSKSSAALAAWS
jgi:aspartyl/asparaginyl beta-hydroxylase (cupin superfamily)